MCMSERSAVQNPMIKYAQQIGWAYVRPDDALRLRGGETGRFFTEVLAAQLVALNPSVVDAARSRGHPPAEPAEPDHPGQS